MRFALSEVIRAAEARRASLTGETAGYLVLLVLDQVLSAPRNVTAENVVLREDGAVGLLAGRACDEASTETELRELLRELLGVSRSGNAGLFRAAMGGSVAGLPGLVRELEAALIPVNRGAAKRAMSRLHREVERAGAPDANAVEAMPRGAAPPSPHPVAGVAPGAPEARPEPSYVSPQIDVTFESDYEDVSEVVELLEAGDDSTLLSPIPPRAEETPLEVLELLARAASESSLTHECYPDPVALASEVLGYDNEDATPCEPVIARALERRVQGSWDSPEPPPASGAPLLLSEGDATERAPAIAFDDCDVEVHPSPVSASEHSPDVPPALLESAPPPQLAAEPELADSGGAGSTPGTPFGPDVDFSLPPVPQIPHGLEPVREESCRGLPPSATSCTPPPARPAPKRLIQRRFEQTLRPPDVVPVPRVAPLDTGDPKLCPDGERIASPESLILPPPVPITADQPLGRGRDQFYREAPPRFKARQSDVSELLRSFSVSGDSDHSELCKDLVELADQNTAAPPSVTPPPAVNPARSDASRTTAALARAMKVAGFVSMVLLATAGGAAVQTELSAASAPANDCEGSIDVVGAAPGASVTVRSARGDSNLESRRQRGAKLRFEGLPCGEPLDVVVSKPGGREWRRIPVGEGELGPAGSPQLASLTIDAR